MDINDSFYGISSSGGDPLYDGAASLALQAAMNIYPVFSNMFSTAFIDPDCRNVMHSTKNTVNDSLESNSLESFETGQKSFDSNNTSNPEDKENAFVNERK